MDKHPILLVEDNADDIALMVRALDKCGIKSSIVVVRDGQEALDYLFGEGRFAGRNPQNLPQLTLLDINLPKLNGIEVLKRLRANKATNTIPVVMLTSSDEDRDVVSSYDYRANSYIRKPVSFEDFADTVTQLGRYWLQINTPPR